MARSSSKPRQAILGAGRANVHPGFLRFRIQGVLPGRGVCVAAAVDLTDLSGGDSVRGSGAQRP